MQPRRCCSIPFIFRIKHPAQISNIFVSFEHWISLFQFLPFGFCFVCLSLPLTCALSLPLQCRTWTKNSGGTALVSECCKATEKHLINLPSLQLYFSSCLKLFPQTQPLVFSTLFSLNTFIKLHTAQIIISVHTVCLIYFFFVVTQTVNANVRSQFLEAQLISDWQFNNKIRKKERTKHSSSRLLIIVVFGLSKQDIILTVAS